jgi:hypothetical protein
MERSSRSNSLSFALFNYRADHSGEIERPLEA